MIEQFAKIVPKSLLHKPGFVFFSGRRAFSTPSDLYILGANPGGSPDDYPDATVSRNVQHVLYEASEDWSAYRDDCWNNGLQRGVMHLFKKLKLNPGEVPCSEVVFKRSRNLKELKPPFKQIAEECWDFHQTVIDELSVRVVVCIGKDAGEWVRDKLGAHILLDEFEDMKPGWTCGWKSLSHKNDDGLIVVRLAHAARAMWKDPLSDPTGLVESALELSLSENE